eukprot:12354561-Heterocapsa_arctica.AAC.1
MKSGFEGRGVRSGAFCLAQVDSRRKSARPARAQPGWLLAQRRTGPARWAARVGSLRAEANVTTK